MTEPASYPEKECFNVSWKVKNFSFCCEKIESPEFNFSGDQHLLRLYKKRCEVECDISRPTFSKGRISARIEISFLTRDGSPEESTSGDTCSSLLLPKNVIFGKRRSAFLPEDTLTVRVRFLTDTERGRVFLDSQIGVKRRHFLWTFRDFSKFKGEERKIVEESESHGRIELHFDSLGGNNPTERFYISILRSGGEECYFTFKVHILDVDGRDVHEVMHEASFRRSDGNQQRSGCPWFIKKSKLLAYGNLLLPHDTLSLECEFGVSLGKVTDQNAVTSYGENVAPLLKEPGDILMKDKKGSGWVTELQADLKSILEDGAFHDVSLKIGSEVMKAHKAILSARSPVFRAMFDRDMKEAASSTVLIEDLCAETVRGLLLYMYTDTILDYEWESWKKLYYASDKYEVLSLKKRCVSFFTTNLSVCNVCDCLILADLHQDANLKAAVYDFISENSSAVFSSEQWKELETSNSPLALQFMREMYSSKRIRLN